MERSYDEVLARASEHARQWLDSVPTRPVPPRADVDEMAAVLGGPLPDGPTDPVEVIDLLAKEGEAGLAAIGSGRFYGFVMGGVLPAALAADWLVSAWDQNSGMRGLTPTTAAAEQVAGEWVCDLLGLPAGCAVGFATGATMANFTGLAAGRAAVLARQGWDVNRNGLQGAPRVRVLAGAERHDSIDLDLRYLGLGLPELVPVDDQGRLRADALADALEGEQGPTIVLLQAGNLHSGAFDPFAAAIEAAHRHDAWVHVDGAFGLWGAAVPSLRPLLAGLEEADSWGTDAHKTLNVPYDCGITIVRDPQAVQRAVSMHADYLRHSAGALDPFELVPELSRRAHGVPTWAALRSLGRSGVVGLVEGLMRNATLLADGLRTVPGVEVLNDVVFTQVSFTVGDQARTDEVIARLLAEGTTWITGSRWHDRPILRISVSNAWTDDDDVAATLEALRRALG